MDLNISSWLFPVDPWLSKFGPPEPAFQDAAEAVQDHPGEQARRIHCIIYT